MAERLFQSNGTSLFVQRVPGTEPLYLGTCHSLDSLPDSRGGKEGIPCLDDFGRIVLIQSKRTAPDMLSFTVENLLKPAATYLERMKLEACGFTFFATQFCGERKLGVFGSWERAEAIDDVSVTGSPMGAMLQRDAQDEIVHSHELTGLPPRHDWWEIQSSAETHAVPEDANSMAVAALVACGSGCGPQTLSCDELAVVFDASGAAAAEIAYTTDGGNVWTVPGNLPFPGIDEDIVTVRCFQVGNDTVRTLCVRGTDAGQPLNASYSDDRGVTAWNAVALGATAAEAALFDQSLFVFDENNIWVCTGGGRVYFSSDAGLTFASQGDALVASGGAALNGVYFADENVGWAVGAGDVMIYTLDGGLTWSTAGVTTSGDDILTVRVFSRYRIIVGTDEGNFYQTQDGGTNWTLSTNFTLGGTGDIENLKFVNDHEGYAAHTVVAGTGYLLRTIDGGYSWQRVTGTTGVAGLNAVLPCESNHVFAAGDDDGTIGVILHAV